ncbi:MAG: diguanylate cyclase [Gammaproteobacteria bacterium]|nr:diguanylate cyclase [Gammaproteobacteria bacterium]MBQ0838178.1 diguanylate cyclase [Gammaproteobacteria bacterium]
MTKFSRETASFIDELDAAVEAHMDWTRRVLRCAVLRVSPGEDVLAPLAHTLCRFGRWFSANQERFALINAQSAERLERVHQSMHNAIRSICEDVLANQPGKTASLDAFEQSQSELVGLLADFKTDFLATAVRQDPLTGLPLRYGIEHEFTQIQKSCQRSGTLLYVVMIDIDHFKRVNDNYGHPVGDVALRHLADTLKNSVRGNESLYRFGGEEFLLLLQAGTPEGVVVPVQRILDAVRNTPVVIADVEPLYLTVTLGVAKVAHEETMNSAVERADKALYEGKAAGRDRYVLAADKANK